MTLKNNILAFFIISILGTIGHFIYRFTGNNPVAGVFFPVNESVWEHLKLIFYPTLIYSAFDHLTSKDKRGNYLPATVFSIFWGMLYIIVIYYVSKGVIGKDVEFINIGSYYVAVIISICKKRKILLSDKYFSKNAKAIAFALALLTAFLLAVWSFNPPKLGIFNPPV